MANAKIVIDTQIKGENQVRTLGTNIKKLGRESQLASRRLKTLQASASRATAAFATLGTTIKVGVVASLGAATFGLGKFVTDTFSAGNQVEQLQNRFQLLFGSVEEGGKAFDSLAAFAAKVPFSLEQIAQGSGNLAVISEDAKDLSKIMEITGNVAAATGLDFRQTAEQIQRSFAGGIASADVFRERGVRAMLGFEAGVKVSVEETKKRFFEVFGPGGEFGNATKLLANTLTGQVSMVQDKYFQFRSIVAKSFFEPLKQQIRDLNKELGSNQKQLEKLAKEIGSKLATAFKNIENGIRFLIDNFDKLVLATKIFIGLKLGGIVAGITAQFLLMGKGVARVTGLLLLSNKRLKVFNILIRANPLGILLTAIQLAVVGLIAFRDELKSIVKYIKGKVSPALFKLRDDFKAFDDADLDFFDEEPKAVQDLRQIQKGVENSIESYRRLTIAQKEALSGGFVSKADKFRNYEGANPRGDMRKAEDEAQKKRAEDLASLNNRISMMNREYIRQEAKDSSEYATQTQEQVVAYRKKLASIGIESQKIGDIVGTTWVNGIKEGNSLLENTKNSFKNVALSIAETLVRKSSELLIEQLFIKFADQKIIKQRQLNAEVANQGSLMNSLIGKSKDILSNLGSMFSGGGGGGGFLGSGAAGGASLGGGSKWGALFNIGRSFLGFNEGGIVPGGAPYTDRIPAMLTPGEVVVPRDKANSGSMGGTNITNINISGNVDQRSIDQIKAVISSSQSEVGGANRGYQANTKGIKGRNI